MIYQWVIPLMALSASLASADDAWTFKGPFGVAVNSHDVIHVAEIQGRRISRFTTNGEWLEPIRVIEGYGELAGPFDVAFGPGDRMYIADTKAHRIIALDPDGKLLFVLGSGEKSARPEDFGEPHFIAVNAKGELFVADTFNARIKKYSPEGKLIHTWGKAGSEPGDFLHNGYVGQLTLDGKGNLYVRDFDGGRIYKFTEDGEYLDTFSERGNQPGQLDEGYGCQVIGNRLVCADTFASRIQFFDLDGKLLEVWAPGEGNTGEHFNHPVGIDAMSNGDLVVTDWKNNRVLRLSTGGQFLATWGKSLADLLAWQPPAIHPRPLNHPIKVGIYAGFDDGTLEKCRQQSIDIIYPSFTPQSAPWPLGDQARKAGAKGVEVHPSIAALAFNRDTMTILNEHPELRMWKKGATAPIANTMSWAQPEARRLRATHIAEQVKRTGAQGVMLDYIRYLGTDYGYDPIAVEGFMQKHGVNPLELPQDDPRWTQYRADFITDFIYQLRCELAKNIPDRHVEISVYIASSFDGSGKQLTTSMQDWPTWAKAGLIDRLHVPVYSRDFDAIYDGVRKVRSQVPDRVIINAFIACYGGNLNTPELLTKGFEAAIAAGADEVTVYRVDVVEELNLWDTIGTLSRRFKSQQSAKSPYRCPFTEETMTLDGKLDEPVWKQAQPIDRFQLFRPDNGSYPHQTVGRLAWNADNLYVAFECTDDDIRSASTEHDALLSRADVVELYIKYGPEHPQYYEIVSAPNGTTFDVRWPDRNAGSFEQFTSWESGMKSAVTVRGTPNQSDDNDEGFTVEIAIPWSAFDDAQSPPIPGTQWTFGLFRYDYSARFSQAHLLMSLASAPHHGFHYYEAYHPIRFD